MTTNKNNIKDNKSPQAINPNWIYGLLLFFIIVTFFINPISNIKEISWLQFEQNILSQHEVEKIVVVNKEVAEIYIKQDRLENEKHKTISDNVITGNTGPYYIIQIGAVESFDSKLENAQQQMFPY